MAEIVRNLAATLVKGQAQLPSLHKPHRPDRRQRQQGVHQVFVPPSLLRKHSATAKLEMILKIILKWSILMCRMITVREETTHGELLRLQILEGQKAFMQMVAQTTRRNQIP